MQNLKNEIENLHLTLNKKSSSRWIKDYSLTRLAAIAADPDYPWEIRHMAAEASK